MRVPNVLLTIPKPIIMITENKIFNLPSLMGIFIALIFFFVFTGCVSEGSGFALPDGDAAAGKIDFVQLNCNACHSIADIEWLGNEENLKLPLGGKVPTIKTYGELLTAVINPSHKISKSLPGALVDSLGHSKMKIYNEVMTVQELVDIVTFLQAEYDVIVPEHTQQYPNF